MTQEESERRKRHKKIREEKRWNKKSMRKENGILTKKKGNKIGKDNKKENRGREKSIPRKYEKVCTYKKRNH